ncbi:MAG TPA: sensor histidine kinase [Ktedonobacteraceae bacterium]|nr:sensor histidine kinase [Ktedonobacteraceae bacterium]
MFTEKITTSPECSPADRQKRTWWLIPKPFDLVSTLLYLGVLGPFLYSFFTGSGYSPPRVWWQTAVMAINSALLLGIDRWEFHLYGERKTPIKVATLFLCARIVLIETLCWLDQFKFSPSLYLIVLFLGCLYFGDAAGYALGALAWAVYILKHFYYNPNWWSEGTERQYCVLFTIGCVFAITIARVVLRERASRARAEDLLLRLEHSNQQLQAYAAEVAELATTRERNRLAREIHDSLGHYLTVINVQLEKSLTFRAKKPQEADLAVNDAKHMAREALQDVRRSVSALRTTGGFPAFFPSITALVTHAQSEQAPIALQMAGNDAGYSPQSLLTLYRVVQEGLTNAQKHARASQIQVDLNLGEKEATLRLHDNGLGFDITNLQKEGVFQGYGLRGVQERLELVGGRLDIESAPGQGTTLLVIVPGNVQAHGE